MNKTLLILLSTYQGAAYLEAQLDSIIVQSYSNWTLLIRDDGSSDKTLEIIARYVKRDQRIHLIKDALGNLKPANSYAELIKIASTRAEAYIFFCDQDDYWLPDKLTHSLALLEKLSLQYGEAMPLLIHSDLSVVDANLKTINPSYLAYEKLTANLHNPLYTLLAANYVTGCTVGMNKALLQFCAPLPEQVIMHDWWCAICAALVGKIGFIKQATVFYRQHSANQIGSKGFYNKLRRLFTESWRTRKYNFQRKFAQARFLAQRIEATHPYSAYLDSFSKLPELTPAKRVIAASCMPIHTDSWLSKIFFLLQIWIL